MKLKGHINSLINDFKKNKHNFLKKSDFMQRSAIATGVSVVNLFFIFPQTRQLYDYFYKNTAEITHIVNQINLVLFRTRSQWIICRSSRHRSIW
jgi:hypothetical protein